ncbi:UNVERIFIED_CONTAM: hypothetical protein Sradi_5750500 [Sesamum radiatum]|uniref:Uncharacterized protein n=1 Tax=Sesamum radiatum TaxID=300843 RepID=A0AAW2L4A8_SESRA
MDEILKILPDLRKDLTDLKTEVTDLKKNQRDSPEHPSLDKNESGTPLEQYLFYTRRERRWKFQSQKPETKLLMP